MQLQSRPRDGRKETFPLRESRSPPGVQPLVLTDSAILQSFSPERSLRGKGKKRTSGDVLDPAVKDCPMEIKDLNVFFGCTFFLREPEHSSEK